MARRTAVGTIVLLLITAGFAAGKDRDWKTGRVSDGSAERVIAPGASRSHGTVDSFGNVNLVTRPSHRTIDESTFIIDAGGLRYTAGQTVAKPSGGLLTRSLAHRKRCQLVIGDPVQYVKEKGTLIVLDSEGKECKLDLLKQERVP